MLDGEDQLLEANEAVEYLKRKWGIPYTLGAFRALRFRRKEIMPALKSQTATFWRKSDLDKIEKPDRSRPRQRRKKRGKDELDGSREISVTPHVEQASSSAVAA